MTSRRGHYDVAVVGSGLVGLSIATHLLCRGLRVAVLGGELSGRASTAAAGMLTPACEYDPWLPAEFLDLLIAGQRYYPEFLRDNDLPESEVGYRVTDFTLLDLDERPDPLISRMEWMPKLGFDCRWLDNSEVCRLEPDLSPAVFRGGIRIRGEALVNPVALWGRLGTVVTERGAGVRPLAVTGLNERAEQIVLETADGEEVLADRVVLAAGAWTGEVAALAGMAIPLCPVKGQMIQLAGPPGAVRSVVFMPSGGCGSVVERAPGEYVVGTSEEYLRPTPDNTAGVVGTLLSRIVGVIPGAADWSVERMWAGFRPMTPDELPVIGISSDPRILVATGHHRNGVLLAPITGRLIADLLLGTLVESGPDLTPFRYGRPMRSHARFAAKY